MFQALIGTVKLCEGWLEGLVVTCDGELVGLAADVEVQPAAPLGVVAAAEARHALRALLVDVHVACCNTVLFYFLSNV